jgi:hypothetical protein
LIRKATLDNVLENLRFFKGTIIQNREVLIVYRILSDVFRHIFKFKREISYTSPYPVTPNGLYGSANFEPNRKDATYLNE